MPLPGTVDGAPGANCSFSSKNSRKIMAGYTTESLINRQNENPNGFTSQIRFFDGADDGIRTHTELSRCGASCGTKCSCDGRSFASQVKAAGVSDFIAREIIGHDSAAVSRQYSHLSTEHKRNAMRNLPDVTT
jgi:hypothetical protein